MRHTVMALLAVLIASAITACGGDSVALDPAAEAATKTAAVNSMRLEMTMTTTSPQFGSAPVTFTTKGVTAGKRTAMTMQMPAVAGVELGEIEVRSDGAVVYMRMPFLQQQAPQLKPWLKFDLRQAGKDAGIDLDALMELSDQMDPTKALEFLRAAGDVDELGDATVRGVQTNHYKAVIDLERYANQLEEKSGGKPAARALRKAVALTGNTTMPIEFWIDEDSLVRRLAWEQAVAADAGQDPTTVKATMDLFDYGADVNVVLPPDSQTSSLTELQKLGEGS